MLLQSIIFEWEVEKAKEESFDRYLLNTGFSLTCEKRAKYRRKKKAVTLLLGHIILMEIDGSDSTFGEQTAILFSTFWFCLIQQDFYFY